MKKTNAARILEQAGIHFTIRSFAAENWDLSAEMAADLLGLPPDRVFKTLIARGDRTGVISASIPAGCELDLKALARLSKDKKVEMVSLKEVQQLTGYMRGAVSPVGMRHNYPYYLDQSVFNHTTIIVSAGARGVQLEISPAELIRAAGARVGIICRIQ